MKIPKLSPYFRLSFSLYICISCPLSHRLPYYWIATVRMAIAPLKISKKGNRAEISQTIGEEKNTVQLKPMLNLYQMKILNQKRKQRQSPWISIMNLITLFS